MAKLIISLLLIFIIDNNTLLCQNSVTKSVDLVAVSCKNQELITIIDSVFNSEKNCDYYNDTLLLCMTFILNPENEKMVSVYFETGTNMKAVFNKEKHLQPQSFFIYDNHYCMIFNYVPNELFESTDKKERFVFQNTTCNFKTSGKQTKDITISTYEDDSFSNWTYYFYNDRFHFYDHYSYCH